MPSVPKALSDPKLLDGFSPGFLCAASSPAPGAGRSQVPGGPGPGGSLGQSGMGPGDHAQLPRPHPPYGTLGDGFSVVLQSPSWPAPQGLIPVAFLIRFPTSLSTPPGLAPRKTTCPQSQVSETASEGALPEIVLLDVADFFLTSQVANSLSLMSQEAKLEKIATGATRVLVWQISGEYEGGDRCTQSPGEGLQKVMA